MKKVFYIIAAITLFCGCHKMEEFDQPTLGGVTGENLLPEVIYAYMADESQPSDSAETRTYVGGDGHSVLWHQGDKISFFVYNYHNVELENNSADGASTAEFHKVSEPVQDDSKIEVATPKFVYPYNAATTCIKNGDVETLVVNYPAKQTYAPNSFGRGANLMVAASESADKINQIYFRNACGYLIIKLNGAGEKVKSIRLTALGDEVKIAGKAHIVAHHDAAPEVTMTAEATSSVTLNCGDGVELTAEDTEFWFALPPVTFKNGLEIEITDGDNNIVKKSTTKEVVVHRNKIQPMAAFSLHPRLYYTRPTGSTQPLTFGTTTPFNVEPSAHYYDEEDGRFVIAFETPVTKINNSAFKGTDITSIIIPASVTEIGNDVFDECTSLSSVTFNAGSDNLRIGFQDHAIDKGPFYDSPLSYINLNREIVCVNDGPNGLNTWDEGVFVNKYYDDTNLATTVLIGENVKTISKYMFSGVRMQSLTIPSTVNSIEKNAFQYCYALAAITIEPSTTALNMECMHDGVLFEDNIRSPFIHSDLKNIDINRDINYLDNGQPYTPLNYNQGIFGNDNAASEENYTTVVTIGENVKKIYNGMFGGRPIKNVTIPSTVTEICEDAFSYCSKLESITFSGSAVTKIGHSAFSYCTSLQAISIPGSVTFIDDFAFQECTSLAEVTIEAGDTPLKMGFQPYGTYQVGPFYHSPLRKINLNREITLPDAYGYNLDEWDEGVFAIRYSASDTWEATVSIGEKVETISKYMFSGVRVTRLILPVNVSKIEDYAFCKCYVLGHVECQRPTPPTLGKGVFDECSALTNIMVSGGEIMTNYKNATNWSAYANLMYEPQN